MSSKPRLRALVACVALSLVVILFLSPVRAQVYFTGPYGPGGTWNLYEHRGFSGAERVPGARQASTWLEAHQDAIGRIEPLSGANVHGHLASFSGPTAQQENDFVADRLRTELSEAWIGLTDNEAFGGGEAGNNRMAGFGNPPGDGIGWKWANAEVFDFANWSSIDLRPDVDFVRLLGDGTWFAGFSLVRSSYIVEYETHSPAPINLPPMPQAPLLPGPAPRPGAFAIREVAKNGPIEGPQGSGSVSGAIRSLKNIGPDAIVRDYYAPVIDHQGEFTQAALTGPSRPFEVLQRGDIPFGQSDDFASVAHGQIIIPEGQGGDWTFSVRSDDGFELYIPGARFEPVPYSAFATQYGSMWFPYDRGAFRSLGHVSLQPGIHDIELIYYENEIFASVELSAALGRKTMHDNSFALVGAPAQRVIGRTPAADTFSVTQVQRVPNGLGDPTPSEQINSVDQAKELLAAPDPNDRVATMSAAAINHDTIVPTHSSLGPYGRYDGDTAFTLSGNDFAAIATSRILVPAAGTYTFGFSVLDGGEFTITGAQFNESFGEGAITNGGESLTLDRSVGDGVAFASVDLLPGIYPIEFVTYNRDGEALAELFAAPGRVAFFDAGAFALLDRTPESISYIRPAGLQLVPEPATLLSAIIGALIVMSIALGRLRRRARPSHDLSD
jgi:hypothetical protein